MGLLTALGHIRAEQHRRTDPMAPGSNFIGYISPNSQAKVSAGKLWLASGLQSITLGVGASEAGSGFLLMNPAGSGINVALGFVITSQTGAVRLTYRRDATFAAGLTVVAMEKDNGILGAVPLAASKVTAQMAVNPMGPPLEGGTVVARALRNESHDTPLQLPPFILTPGHSVGLSFVAPAAVDTTATVFWIEE